MAMIVDLVFLSVFEIDNTVVCRVCFFGEVLLEFFLCMESAIVAVEFAYVARWLDIVGHRCIILSEILEICEAAVISLD